MLWAVLRARKGIQCRFRPVAADQSQLDADCPRQTPRGRIGTGPFSQAPVPTQPVDAYAQGRPGPHHHNYDHDQPSCTYNSLPQSTPSRRLAFPAKPAAALSHPGSPSHLGRSCRCSPGELAVSACVMIPVSECPSRLAFASLRNASSSTRPPPGRRLPRSPRRRRRSPIAGRRSHFRARFCASHSFS